LRVGDGLLLRLAGMELRAPQPHETAAIRALLRDSDLPTDDLDAAPVEFLVAFDGNGLAAVGGLEVRGNSGLLRSLAVRPGLRGSGLGSALLRALETTARERGLRELVLLTLTAAPFFARHGYVELPRGDASREVQDSAEFRLLCPASATCMSRSIELES
jgi:amino-acid N-acetyltransferase